jgi:hypothetical protein
LESKIKEEKERGEIFDICIKDIKNSHINKKANEITIDFQSSEKKEEDSFYQIKFCLPKETDENIIEVKYL